MPTKILHLIPRFTAGGAERLVLEYAKRLPDFGYEVAVASVRGGGELIKEFEKIEKNFHIVRGSSGSVSFWTRVRQLGAFVRDWQPDIIHSHVFSADVMAFLLHRKFDITWISTQHSLANYHKWHRRLIFRKILQEANRAIAVSPAVAGDVEKYLHVDKRRISLITNGIDLAPWLEIHRVHGFDERNAYITPAIRAQTPSSPPPSGGRIVKVAPPSGGRIERIRLAIIGRLEHQKGHDILFRALASLRDLPWELHIYGDGDRQRQLENLARELGISDRVHWHGVVADLPQEFANIDCVVQPSRFEGMSLAVMEAMAAGRVIIASEAAGAGLIEDKKTGLIVPNDDVEALTKTLKYAIQEHQKLVGIGERAREFAREHFGIERHINQLCKLYDEFKKK